MWPFKRLPAGIEPIDPLEQLLEDARLLVLYCVRTGSLQDNDLPAAIARFESAADKGWKSDETVALQTAVNKAVLSIAPVSLHDLRDRPPAIMMAKRLPLTDFLTFVVVLLTAGIMVYTAQTTLSYNRTTTLISEMEQFQKENTRSEMTTMVFKIAENVAKIGTAAENGEKDVTLAVIHNDIHAIKAIDDRLETVSNEFDALIASQNSIQHYSLALVTPVSAQSDTYAQGPQPSLCSGAKAAERPLLAPPQQEGSGSKPLPPTITSMLTDDNLRSLFVTCAANLRFDLINYPNFDALQNQLQISANMNGLWILPALYGGLGAALFHMRLVLSPRLPSPSWARIFHRLAIGAFAGVILGWFWAPSGSTKEFTNIGLNVFGVAFLVGYSIDVFFGLLDRLIALLTTGISQINASNAPNK